MEFTFQSISVLVLIWNDLPPPHSSGLVITEAIGKWDTYPVFLYPSTLCYTQGTQVSSKNQGNSSNPYLLILPSFPAYVLGLTLPRPPDPPFFYRGSPLWQAQSLLALWHLAPGFTFFLYLSQRRLSVQYQSLFLHFVLFLVLDTQSFSLKVNSGKKSSVISLTNSLKKYVLATCCSDEVLNMVMRK